MNKRQRFIENFIEFIPGILKAISSLKEGHNSKNLKSKLIDI